MKTTVIFLVLTTTFLQSVLCNEFQKVYQWKQLAHRKQEDTARSNIVFREQILPQPSSFNESFDSYNNIPMGVTHHKGRLFITIPRRRPGVPATLNVIHMDKVAKDEQSPPLDAYPDYIINQLHNDHKADPKRIVSVYRSKVDACDRLWFVDTGMLEYPDNPIQVQRPQLWIIDLSRDRKVRTFEIPESIVQQGVGMASLVVDVEVESCDKAFAYIPDLVQGAIYVYSFEKNRMWSFNHSSFSHNPDRANFFVAGQRFQWDDGIFSITLGKRNTTWRPVYYHPMVSTSEFTTSTATLQNETLANAGSYASHFQSLGERGPNTQSTMHHHDPETDVIFYAEVNRNAIGCWNTQNNFTTENHDIIQLDHKGLIYPTDLNVSSDAPSVEQIIRGFFISVKQADVNGTIWVLANNLPTWIYARLDVNQFNFHVWRQTPRKAIAGTKCDMY